MASRYDRAPLPKPVRTKEGFARIAGYPTRAGVFEYVQADGSVRRELRHPDEVFHADSLATLAGVSVTEGHPGLVTVDNIKKVRVGVVVGEASRAELGRVQALLQIDDPRVIDSVFAKTYKELSCGYTCDTDPTPGEYQGQRYDVSQTNIRYNHLAIVDKGRAGSECSLRLDEAEQTAPASETEQPTAPDAQPEPMVAPVVEDALALANARIITLEGELKAARENAGTEKTRGDALDAALKSEKSRADAAQVRLDAHARKDLESTVLSVLPELRQDGVSDNDLRNAVVGKFLPEIKLDGAAPEYARAMFDAAMVVARSAPKKTSVAGTSEAFKDLVAEARAERAARNAKAAGV